MSTTAIDRFTDYWDDCRHMAIYKDAVKMGREFEDEIQKLTLEIMALEKRILDTSKTPQENDQEIKD